jgi:hypothetical protein
VSWLLFLDESGHDHKAMPLEVGGGVAIHVSKLWGFIQNWQRLEYDVFGLRLADFGKEAKGMKLLDKDRIRWAAQGPAMAAEERRKHIRIFLARGALKASRSGKNLPHTGKVAWRWHEVSSICSVASTRGYLPAPFRAVHDHTPALCSKIS